MYDKNLLNLLKLSIPNISTCTSTIFSVETLEKVCCLCNGVYLIKIRLRIPQLLKIYEHFYPFPHYFVFMREYSFIRYVVFTPQKKCLQNVNSKW